ncbi:MAG: hypothetical protein K6G90_04400 [Clostridia bacterium]|nr:hypothetical protein [Clostridia bacterium]
MIPRFPGNTCSIRKDGGAKPGKEDFFFALEDDDFIRRNRPSFIDHMPQVNGSFDDEAAAEIRAGIPHVYVIPVDCLSVINEIMSEYIHDPAPSNARLKDLIVMIETATDIPHVQRQDPCC